MMTRILFVLSVCLLVCSSGFSQDQAKQTAPARIVSPNGTPGSEARLETTESSPAGKLPVRRVVLYKNGVGYFEHLGRVRGSQDVHIDFTSA
jgi:hypothetical protein